MLMLNEQMSKLLVFWANCSVVLWLTKNERFAQKNLTKIVFFCTFCCKFFSLNKRFAHSLFYNEQCEPIAQVTHQKWAIQANCSGRSLFAHFFQKTSDSLRKPMSKFPTRYWVLRTASQLQRWAPFLVRYLYAHFSKRCFALALLLYFRLKQKAFLLSHYLRCCWFYLSALPWPF